MWSIRPFTLPSVILLSRLKAGVSGVCAGDGVATSGRIVAIAKGRRVIRIIGFIVCLAASALEHDRKSAEWILVVSLLHRIALPGACAPKVNTVLICRRPASDRLGE